MSTHVTDRLSAYLDDDLDATDREAVEAHLRACRACTNELDGLRRLVSYAGTVTSTDVPPSRDLWPGIQARLTPVAQPRPASAPQSVGAARRVSFSIAQLAAAAVLLMAVSGATAWFLRGGIADGRGTMSAPAIQAEVEPTPAPDAVRPVNFADAQYDAAIADLERTLEERRNDLNARTVEILERNLKLIDAAIAQARQALEEDPGNAYLNRHLVESRRRKLDLLRRAAAINEAD
jgi:tetratricopeptide (TPR) repeat protein